MKINLSNVRLAFAQNVFTPGTVNGEGEPAYSVTCLLDAKAQAKQIADIDAAAVAVAKEKWGAKADAILKQMRAQDKFPVHDGDTKANYDGFEGTMFVSTRSKVRPLVIDRDKTPLVAADGRPYSGCYANVQIELWAQDNQYGKRVNAQLKGIQFVKDGDAFGGGGTPAAADDFEDLGDTGEDDLSALA